MKTTIACVGGFLGAGKTTALQAAAAELGRRGKIVAVITNDQGSELVDTAAMRRNGVATAEITGGCFCCNFDNLVTTMTRIVEQRRPHVILAEAVGSCTDLSATVYQPLRRYHPDAFALAPLSVLVEPGRIRSLRKGGVGDFPDSVRYLFQKQLAEADLILLSKADTLEPVERREAARWLRDTVGDVPVQTISARQNTGVTDWVDRLLDGGVAGGRLLDIDYDIYAAAEAVLGWLNATVELTSAETFAPHEVAAAFIESVRRGAEEAAMAIAHVKAMVAAGNASDRIAVTDDRGEAEWSGAGRFEPATRMSLIVNARVRAEPGDLERLVRHALDETALAFALAMRLRHMECFSPARPTPRHRFTEIAV
jgi:Ni2+-binding GTPase involved in maturation of urease and hydrogenase